MEQEKETYSTDEVREYKKALSKNISKSQDYFEKQLTWISSGSIGVSMLIVDKLFIVEASHCRILLPIGWSLMGATLLLNLFSHFYSYRKEMSIVKALDEGLYHSSMAIKKNLDVDRINMVSASSLIVGIFSFIIYISINIYTMSDKLGPKKGDSFEKGKNVSPLRPQPNQNPAVQAPAPQQQPSQPPPRPGREKP